MGQDSFYDYYSTKRPQMTTRAPLESPRQALSNDTLFVSWGLFLSEEQNSQKCDSEFGPLSSPCAFYHYYQARRPQTTTRVSLESPWSALSIDTLVVIWLFVPSEERNSQKWDRKFGPFSSPPDAFYNYYRTRRPQTTTRVSLESPWQALSKTDLVVIWVFVPSEERNSQKCNRKFGPFSSPSDARRLLQLLPNQKTPDNNQGIFGKPLTRALY